ncbi:unnamed protein product [Polarella glacialis]|uniref:DUF4116 domain-containing protein n=1 Tax=Polarella glacialis TaxID=89957 RepID=A0A813GWU8_POLGL|nr:unnamed protein product [Polarella glacialis]
MIRLHADKQLALAAVSRRGSLLKHVRPELRQDREVVLAAVRQRGRALEFAAECLRGDHEVVIAALSAQGGHRALSFTSPQLQTDLRIQATAQEANARRGNRSLEVSSQDPAEPTEDLRACESRQSPSATRGVPLFSAEVLSLIYL